MASRQEIKRKLREVKPTMTDNIVGFFSPERQLKRFRARQAMALIGGGGYNSGSRKRKSFNGYRTTESSSADSDILPDLETIRDRSRDLIRNNTIATSSINTKEISVVGTGLVYHSSIDYKYLGLTREDAEQWQRDAEREFKLFAKCCNIEENLTFTALQSLAFRSRLESGDVLCVRRFNRRPHQIYGTKLQLIEADRLRNKDNAPDTAKLSAGIEVDQFGAASKYHIASSHSGYFEKGSEVTWSIIDAWNSALGLPNVLHIFKKLRPHQSRGVPDLAPVIETIKQLGDYKENELTASVINSLFTAFISSPSGETGLDSTDPLGDEGFDGDDDIELAPGAVAYLADGEQINFADPKRPNTAAEAFINLFCEEIGTAIHLPKEVLMKSFKSSYSAAQAALLEAWRYFRTERKAIVESLCEPVLEMFLHEAVALGRLDAPGFFDDPSIRLAYCGARWVGPPKGHVDELKAVNAAEKRVNNEFSTRKAESAELGNDYESNHEQRAHEERLAVEDGTRMDAIPMQQVVEVDSDN